MESNKSMLLRRPTNAGYECFDRDDVVIFNGRTYTLGEGNIDTLLLDGETGKPCFWICVFGGDIYRIVDRVHTRERVGDVYDLQTVSFDSAFWNEALGDIL